MDLNQLATKIERMIAATHGRIKATTDDALRTYAQGYGDALSDVASILKQAREAERMRQRLARLETDLSQEPELNWSRGPKGEANPAAAKGAHSSAKASPTIVELRPEAA
jgi:hypothetical protein